MPTIRKVLDYMRKLFASKDPLRKRFISEEEYLDDRRSRQIEFLCFPKQTAVMGK